MVVMANIFQKGFLLEFSSEKPFNLKLIALKIVEYLGVI